MVLSRVNIDKRLGIFNWTELACGEFWVLRVIFFMWIRVQWLELMSVYLMVIYDEIYVMLCHANEPLLWLIPWHLIKDWILRKNSIHSDNRNIFQHAHCTSTSRSQTNLSKQADSHFNNQLIQLYNKNTIQVLICWTFVRTLLFIE